MTHRECQMPNLFHSKLPGDRNIEAVTWRWEWFESLPCVDFVLPDSYKVSSTPKSRLIYSVAVIVTQESILGGKIVVCPLYRVRTDIVAQVLFWIVV